MIMKVSEITEQFKLHPITAEVLKERGIDQYDDIYDFLNPDFSQLNAPSLLGNITKAVNEIKTSIEFNENIVIFTDYDVDGITSGALLYQILKNMDANVDVIVGNRYIDGYGLSRSAIDDAKIINRADLLITVDLGIGEKDNIEYAEKLGMNVIVVDHHEPEEEKKPDCIIVNPKNDNYPFKHLSGCGVTWKLCQCLTGEELYEYLDIVALSTIADVVDLVKENRVIVYEGLKTLSETANLGLKTLIEVAGLSGKELSTGDVGFKIAPMINAVGRLGSADICLELLVTEDKDRAKEIANILYKNNEERKRISREAVKKAEAKINHFDNIIIVEGKFKEGIIGILAGDLKEKFKKPAIVIDKKTGKGSCRSLPPLRMHEFLKYNEEFLESYGGHAMAAGLKVKKGKLEDFKKEANKQLKGVEYQTTNFDLEIGTRELSIELVEDLEKLAPFGKGNPKPKFKSTCVLLGVNTIGKDKQHLRFWFDDDIEGIGFNLIGHINKCESKILEVIYSPEINDFRGKKLQMNVKRFKSAGALC